MPHPIEGPSSRFRVYQYQKYLEEQGVEVLMRPFFTSKQALKIYGESGVFYKVIMTLWATLMRIGDLLRAPRYDAVYVLREAFPFGPPLFETLFKKLSGKLLFDFDDAIYMRSLVFDNPLDRLRDWDKPNKVVNMSDHVVAGSYYLANWAQKYAGPKTSVSVLPTVVDANLYEPSTLKKSDEIVIGWIGTPRGSSYLQTLLPLAKELSKSHKHVRWVFVGAEPFDAEGAPIEFRTWALDREVPDIQSFDIGIMPLTDDEETRGKCGFKLIQYMSCGVAVVGSPVGVNKEIVEDGVSGLLADTPEQWSENILRLLNDSEFRARCVRNGRARSNDNYSLQVTGPKMVDIIKQTLEA